MANEITHRPPAEIERLGFAVLCEHLGRADAIRFMQQFSLGQGDYTRQRAELLKDDTVDSILGNIEQQKS